MGDRFPILEQSVYRRIDSLANRWCERLSRDFLTSGLAQTPAMNDVTSGLSETPSCFARATSRACIERGARNMNRADLAGAAPPDIC